MTSNTQPADRTNPSPAGQEPQGKTHTERVEINGHSYTLTIKSTGNLDGADIAKIKEQMKALAVAFQVGPEGAGKVKSLTLEGNRVTRIAHDPSQIKTTEINDVLGHIQTRLAKLNGQKSATGFNSLPDNEKEKINRKLTYFKAAEVLFAPSTTRSASTPVRNPVNVEIESTDEKRARKKEEVESSDEEEYFSAAENNEDLEDVVEVEEDEFEDTF